MFETENELKVSGRHNHHCCTHFIFQLTFVPFSFENTKKTTGNKWVIVIMREQKSQHKVSNSTAAFDWNNSWFETAISNSRKRDQANALWVCNDGK